MEWNGERSDRERGEVAETLADLHYGRGEGGILILAFDCC